MANNPYVNKVELADGTTLLDISDTTALAADVIAGKEFYLATGQKVVGTLDILNTFFPIGSIYTSSNSSAPTFGGTWREVKIMASWDDLKNGNRSYTAGTGTGTLHYWQRTA